MKIEEVRSKTDAELDFELEGFKKELFDLRFRTTAETATSPARIRPFAGVPSHGSRRSCTSGPRGIRGQESR